MLEQGLHVFDLFIFFIKTNIIKTSPNQTFFPRSSYIRKGMALFQRF